MPQSRSHKEQNRGGVIVDVIADNLRQKGLGMTFSDNIEHQIGRIGRSTDKQPEAPVKPPAKKMDVRD